MFIYLDFFFLNLCFRVLNHVGRFLKAFVYFSGKKANYSKSNSTLFFLKGKFCVWFWDNCRFNLLKNPEFSTQICKARIYYCHLKFCFLALNCCWYSYGDSWALKLIKNFLHILRLMAWIISFDIEFRNLIFDFHHL